MKFSSIIFLAAGLVAAQEETTTTDSTTTLTSTLTRTMTITRCNPSFTDCPFATATEEEETATTEVETSTADLPSSAIVTSVDAFNTTLLAPTGGFTNNTTPVTIITSTQTAIGDAPSNTGTDEPLTTTSGSDRSLYLNSGLLVGVLAVGAALL